MLNLKSRDQVQLISEGFYSPLFGHRVVLYPLFSQHSALFRKHISYIFNLFLFLLWPSSPQFDIKKKTSVFIIPDHDQAEILWAGVVSCPVPRTIGVEVCGTGHDTRRGPSNVYSNASELYDATVGLNFACVPDHNIQAHALGMHSEPCHLLSLPLVRSRKHDHHQKSLCFIQSRLLIAQHQVTY